MTDLRDTSDPKQIAKAIKSSKERDEARAEGLRQMLSTKEGRLWLHDVLEACGPYRTPYSRDPIQMAFNCGTADVGLKLIAECHAVNADLYLVMMKENSNG